MKTINIGRSSVISPVIGLGTWAIGGWMWGGTNAQESISAIHASLDAGATLIDTAPAYGMGVAEELVGQAIKGRRDQAIIATKCGLVWHKKAGTHFFDQAGQGVYRYLGKESIAYEVEQSLTRLGTDYIDIYFTHWQDDTTSIAETMEALITLKKQGKIRAIGVSNASPSHVLEYLRWGQVDAVQEKYSLLDRGLEKEIIPLCQEQGITVVGYSSLALGLLAGPIAADKQFGGDDQRKGNPRFSPDNRQRMAKFFADIEPLVARKNCSFAQLMVAWTLFDRGVGVALCGARTAAQALQNAQAGQLEITKQDAALIEAAVKQHVKELL